MNPIVAHGPLRVASFVWRRGDGRKSLTIVCKATYELRPDISPLAREQEDIHAEDVHWGGDPRHSLRAPSDFVPFKQRADVLVTGHAYAPEGRTVRSLRAHLAVGALKKVISVYGDRSFLPTGELSEPAEFNKVPLCWERAAGGAGTVNPVGVTVNPFVFNKAWRWAPNIQPPEIFVATARDPFPPAGMGPLAPTWPDRLKKLGRFAVSWDHRGWSAHPLPGDVDAGYFNSAPPDQQAETIAPDERIELQNLHPAYPRLVTRLDGVVPHAVLRRPNHPDHPLNLRCDTLWIDTDRGICCLTWRGSIALEMAENGEIHVTIDQRRGATTPKAESPQHDSPGAYASRSGEPVGGAGEPLSAIETMTIDLGFLAAVRSPAVPFIPAAPGAAPSVAAAPPVRELPPPGADATATLAGPLFVEAKALPEGWTESAVAAPLEPEIAKTPPASPEEIAPPSIPAPSEDFATPTPRLPSEPFGLPRPALVGPIASAAPAEPSLPAMIGPIAGAAEPRAPVPPIATAFDPEAFSIEKWAAISAEIDKASRSRAEVLQAHELSDADFGAIDRHWKAALEKEAARGGYSLRFKFDTAYVGALERLRDRPISAREYAQILAASERRQVPAALLQMEMPAAAHMPVVRLWTGKLARDPKLSFEMIQAVAALREGPDDPPPQAS